MRARVALGLLFGAVFLALAFRGVPLAELGAALAGMDARVLAPVAGLFALQIAVRALRQLVLVRGLAPDTGYRDELAILSIGFFCIGTFPARLGEAVRPWLWRRRHGVPLGAGFGVVFAERAIDLLAVLGLVLCVLLWAPPPEAAGAAALAWARRLALVLLAPLLAGLLGLVVLHERALALAASVAAWLERRAPGGAASRIAASGLGFARSFVAGVGALRQPRLLLPLAALTLVTFASVGAITAILARGFGFGDRIGFVEGLGVSGIASLGLALPAPPGFAGVFEGSVRGALALFGVAGGAFDAPALAFALVLHALTWVLQALPALWFLWRDHLAPGELLGAARRTREGPEAA